MSEITQQGDVIGRGHEARAPDVRSYTGPARTGAPRLSDVDGVESVESTEDHGVIEEERYDTAGLRLAGAGVLLAVHRRPDGAFWQLTLPDDGPGTEGLRVPLGTPDVEGVDPEQVPEVIDAEIRGVRGDAPVAPVGRIRIVRTSTSLRGPDAREVAALVRDEVQVATLGTSTSVENWSEAEILPGTGVGGTLLGELDTRLRSTGLTPGPHRAETALAAMLDEFETETPRRVRGKKGSAGAVVLGYVGVQVDLLAARTQQMRDAEPDAVHQMRVSSRRIRSTLRTYRGLFDGPRVEHLIAELKWLGGELAADRDLEVVKDRIETRLVGLAPELVLGPVRAQVTRHFARRQAEARAAALEAVDGQRFARLQGALTRLLVDPPLTPAAGKRAQKVMPAMVARTADKLGKRMKVALRAVEGAEETTGAELDAALHGARRTGKQLRYATEVVRPVVGKQARSFTRGLERLQDELGEHQDAVVARETLRELGAQAGAENQNGFTFGVLYGEDVAMARQAERSVARVWPQVWATKHRRWMG